MRLSTVTVHEPREHGTLSEMHRIRRAGIVTTVVSAAVIGLSSAALAAAGPTSPPDLDSGKEGVHIVIDRPDAPGAHCVYRESDYHLDRIVVQPPIVYGFDRTPGRDPQSVSWRFELWTAVAPNATWSLFGRTGWQTRAASDHSNAPFLAQRFIVPGGRENQHFYVRIRVRWFAPGSGVVNGRGAIGIHNYFNDTPFSDYVTSGDCFGQFT